VSFNHEPDPARWRSHSSTAPSPSPSSGASRTSLAEMRFAESVMVGRIALNVALIVLDAVRADHVSSYGYSRPTTPNLDAFASANTRYATAVSPGVWTFPSMASMFTGLYPSQRGMNRADQTVPPELRLLAERLRDTGYRRRSGIPGIPAGVVERPVGTIDIAPTILELAGLDSAGLAGVSLCATADPRPCLVTEFLDPPLERFNRFHRFDPVAFRRDLRGLLRGDHKYIWSSDGRDELYDPGGHERHRGRGGGGREPTRPRLLRLMRTRRRRRARGG